MCTLWERGAWGCSGCMGMLHCHLISFMQTHSHTPHHLGSLELLCHTLLMASLLCCSSRGRRTLIECVYAGGSEYIGVQVCDVHSCWHTLR